MFLKITVAYDTILSYGSLRWNTPPTFYAIIPFLESGWPTLSFSVSEGIFLI